MLNRFFTFVMLSALGASVSQAQYSRKEIRALDNTISEYYLATQYDSVAAICNRAANDGKPLTLDGFTHWLDAGWKLHDLEVARGCVIHLDRPENNKIRLKLEKQQGERIRHIRRIKDMYEFDIMVETFGPVHQMNVMKEAAQIGGNFWQVQLDLGIGYRQMGELDSAIVPMETALGMAPKNVPALVEVGNVYFMMSRFNDCLNIITRLEKVGYQDDRLYTTKSRCLLETGRPLEALQTLDVFNDRDTLLLPVLELKIEAAQKAHKPYSWLEAQYDIMRILPLDFERINLVSVVLHTEVDSAQQINRLSYLSREYPEVASYWIVHARLLNEKDAGQFPLVLSDLDSAIRYAPNEASIYIEKGNTLFYSRLGEQGDRNAAASVEYEKASLLDSFNFELYDKLCRANMWYNRSEAKRHKTRALRCMRQKLEWSPTNPQVNYEFSQTFDLPENGYGYNVKYNDSIIKYLNLALEYGADSFYILDKRYWKLQATGQYDQAVSDLWWLFDRSVDSRKADRLYSIANIYSIRKMPQKEKEVLMLLNSLYPDNQHIKRRLRDVNRKLR